MYVLLHSWGDSEQAFANDDTLRNRQRDGGQEVDYLAELDDAIARARERIGERAYFASGEFVVVLSVEGVTTITIEENA